MLSESTVQVNSNCMKRWDGKPSLMEWRSILRVFGITGARVALLYVVFKVVWGPSGQKTFEKIRLKKCSLYLNHWVKLMSLSWTWVSADRTVGNKLLLLKLWWVVFHLSLGSMGQLKWPGQVLYALLLKRTKNQIMPWFPPVLEKVLEVESTNCTLTVMVGGVSSKKSGEK